MKTLANLQAECATAGIAVATNGRPKKEDYILALREYHWHKAHPGKPLPAQIMPMLLGSWEDLDEEQAEQIEDEGSGWIVQPKLDGVRCLLHVEGDQVRVTTRCVSEVNYRLSELQDNLPHLRQGWSQLDGTILDGELVCPLAVINTGGSITAHALQAAVAIISTSPENARQVQEKQNAHLRLHVFDLLRHRGTDVTGFPLLERTDLSHQAVATASNLYVESVPGYVINKRGIHDQIIAAGGEGSVWKKSNEPYQPGRRVKHWIKRKRGLELEAFVTGFKPGTAERGHAHLVGALEFSVRRDDGTSQPIAWVCGLTDAEREAMTQANDTVCLNQAYFGRRALITGQEFSAKSKRIQHARIARWLND